jgi:hypothetical protein
MRIATALKWAHSVMIGSDSERTSGDHEKAEQKLQQL